jgi:hypothetical protein
MTETVNLTPNFRAALYEFIAQFAAPVIDKSAIFYGNQNNIALPENNDYIVFSYLSSVRHGTNSERWEKTDGNDYLYLSNTIEVIVQIDCYAVTTNGNDGINAMLRAQALETVARSTAGVQFFNDRGISLLYADDPRDATFVGDSDSYVRRSTLTIHLSFESQVRTSVDYFYDVKLDLKNVDVSYPPVEDDNANNK